MTGDADALRNSSFGRDRDCTLRQVQTPHGCMAARFLIGLATADRNAEPLGHLLDVIDILQK